MGCSCHLNPPCSFCVDWPQAKLEEIMEDPELAARIADEDDFGVWISENCRDIEYDANTKIVDKYLA